MKSFLIIYLLVAMLTPCIASAQFENNSLSQAVDNTQFEFLTESPGFVNQSAVTNFGGDAAASQKIANDDVAVMAVLFEDTLGMGGRVTFDWKVSSEAEFDFLTFLIVDQNENIVQQRQISGERDWATVSVDIPVGNYTLAWGYVKDIAISRGADKGFVDRVRISRNGGSLPASCISGRTPINSALDNDTLEFTDFFGGTRELGFECAEDSTAVGGSSAFSDASRSDTSQAWVEVNPPLDLVFDWRILNGKENFFRVQAYRGNNPITRGGENYFGEIVGPSDWQTFRLRVPREATRVRWVYFNRDDSAPSQGLLDNVRIQEASIAPISAAALQSLFLLLYED